MNYEKLLLEYCDLDEKIYNAIKKIMDDNGLSEVEFDEEQEFELVGGSEEYVRKIRNIKDVENRCEYLEIYVEDGQGGEFEYSLTDDTVSLLDKLSVLNILQSMYNL